MQSILGNSSLLRDTCSEVTPQSTNDDKIT